MKLHAITFDFWNTIAKDSEPVKVRQISAQRMIEELRKVNCEINIERMMDAFVKTRNICYEYQEEQGIDFTPEEQLDWICDFLRISADDKLKEKLLKHYTTSLLEIPPTFIKGLQGLLKELAERGIKLAIISNTGRTPGWVIRELLSAQELTDYFSATSFSNEMRIAKPNPQIFLITAEKLGVLPQNILHVGDDMHTDVSGSQSAGFKACWYNTSNAKPTGKFDVRISHLNQLLNLIE